jgi:lipopolysaccharide/colanic/teichoic acid biosynthesis glycosyltransferase/glycosyltransferase involved in cell wall biosynthesis
MNTDGVLAAASSERQSACPLKVLIVITKGEAGGAQSHVLELCHALKDTVHLTVAIGGEDGSPLALALQGMGVACCSLPNLCNSLNPYRVLVSVRALGALMRQIHPDLIHAHSAVAGVVSRLAAKLRDTPVVYTVHGFSFKPQARPLIRWSAWLAEAILAAWTTRLVCVSRHEQALAELLPMDKGRTCVIPNTIRDVPWRSKPAADCRTVMVARMASPKRHDLLLHALGQLASEHSPEPSCEQAWEPEVTFLGDGPQENELKALASQLGLQRVNFAGAVQGVAQELAQHQIFVLLSDHEGLPISVLEAMRAGMAIVATRLPGMEELVTHGHSALLVRNEVQDVAQALRRLRQSPELRQQLGEAARARYEAHCQPAAMAKTLLEVYNEAPLLPTSAWPMTLAKPHRASMSSERSRLQHSQLMWSLLGLLLFTLAWQISLWLRAEGLGTVVFSQTVLACLLPYAVVSHLLYVGTRLPAAERAGLVLVTTAVPFLLTPLGFSLAQMPFSRGAILLCYGLTATWFLVGWRWLRAGRPLRLVYWHDEQPQRLRALLQDLDLDGRAPDGPELRLLRWPDHWRADPSLSPAALAAHGALNDLPDAGLDAQSQATLSTFKLRHVRLYSPQAVAEALSGRVPRSVLQSELWQLDGNPAFDLIKRLLDLALIALTLPVWLPLGLLTALAVRLDSPGPVVYRQCRSGLHGRPFKLLKFRSMHHDQDAPPQFASLQDPRVTRFGAFMRRTRLDEIPQLWNVVLGHMSLIGPRPEQAAFVAQFAKDIPNYPYRHLVRPGLTGWAQVHQGYASGTEETAIKLSYDLYYVAHYSLALDLLIMAKTLRTVLTGRGAR